MTLKPAPDGGRSGAIHSRFTPPRLTILWAMQPKKPNGVMRLLIIDDEENIRRTTAVALEAIGHETTGAEDRAAAIKQLETGSSTSPFLTKLNGESGLDFLPELLQIDPDAGSRRLHRVRVDRDGGGGDAARRGGLPAQALHAGPGPPGGRQNPREPQAGGRVAELEFRLWRRCADHRS